MITVPPRLAVRSLANAGGSRKSGSPLSGVAYDTVRRAAVLLRERGLIITVHGRGTYVA